ncbi:ATP-binding protein [Cytophagales bacterium LB-30]|uniref:ATP-binding protein n=1 Tax=Shiella aurantiaca TaxID=3058365 RepID=A0ABT8F2U2_9BACT|nr:ATP-binding protein [Shiella aurantiaca]MDN4164544.1 ATP-binding protein [Shiella aurantiaca]
MLKEISKKQVLDRIRFENPWWVNGKIEEDYQQMPRRLYFDLFKPLVYERDIRRAVVLMGPRRVGKTVMLYHMVQDMMESGIDPMKIIFITIENPIYNNMSLEQLFSYAKEASGKNDTSDWYIIFDEIQYCRNWEVHLKSLVDSYRKDKFIVSGSAAAALKFASTESGAGRFTDFLLPPLTFNEYIALKGLDRLIKTIDIEWNGKVKAFYSTNYLEELNKHFIDYINFGGYPEVIFSEKIQANPGRYIRQDIVDKVLLRDLPSLYGISDTRELNSLFTTIAYNSGNEFSLETLSRQSQVPKNTLKKYIEYLEAAYLIKQVKRIDQSGKRFKRDNFFKIYLTNPSLRSALFSPLTATDEMMGSMVETAIFAQWMHKDWFTPWYARWNNGEVDMVGLGDTLKPIWALEIKWTDRYFDKPNELKSLIKFCYENKLQNPIITSISKEGKIDYEGINCQFIPSSSYAYTVGKNTLDMKTNR